jgi:cytochrome c
MKVLVLMLAAFATVPAVADPKLAEKKNCMACHALDQKVVGPPFKEVAKKYAGQPDASAKLAAKIAKGGSGAWGDVPMPPNDVTPDEAKTLADWVLSLK